MAAKWDFTPEQTTLFLDTIRAGKNIKAGINQVITLPEFEGMTFGAANAKFYTLDPTRKNKKAARAKGDSKKAKAGKADKKNTDLVLLNPKNKNVDLRNSPHRRPGALPSIALEMAELAVNRLTYDEKLLLAKTILDSEPIHR